MDLVIGNILLFVFTIVEILIIKFGRKEAIPWKEVVSNLGSGHVLLWVFRGFEIAAYYVTFKYFSLDLVGQFSHLTVWLLAFFLWDFCFYWLHRIHHSFRILWGVHSVHHEGEHFSLSLGIRNSWYSSITSYPFFIIMALIGIPVDIFVAVSSIHYFIQFINHNHLVDKLGFLEYFMVTPSHHRVHHGKNAPYRDRNFSGTLVIWDKLFGTFQEELTTTPVVYGVDHVPKSYNPVTINNSPFVRLFSKTKKASETNPTSPFRISNFMLVSGSVLLYMLLLFYIYFETQFFDHRTIILFLMIFLGTIGSGLISEGHKVGAWIWGVSTLAFPTLLLTAYASGILLFDFLLVLYAVHGLFTLTFLFIPKAMNIAGDRENTPGNI